MAKPKRVTPKSLRVGQTVYSYDWEGKGVRSHFITDNSTRGIILLCYRFGTPYFYKKAAAERYGAGPRWVWHRGARMEFVDPQVLLRKAAQSGIFCASRLFARGVAAAALERFVDDLVGELPSLMQRRKARFDPMEYQARGRPVIRVTPDYPPVPKEGTWLLKGSERVLPSPGHSWLDEFAAESIVVNVQDEGLDDAVSAD